MEWLTYLAIFVVVLGLRVTLRFAHGGFRWGSTGGVGVVQHQAHALAKTARAIPLTSAADAREATVVRLVGEVKEHDRSLVSPIGGARCVYWEAVLYEHRGVGVSQSWEPIAQHSEAISFVLADASGHILIDPSLATMSLGGTETRIFNPGELLPQGVATFLAASGWSIDDMRRRGSPIRFDQTMLAIGRRVAAVGAGSTVDRHGGDGDLDYRSPPATWLLLDGRNAELLISDAKPLLRGAARVDESAAKLWPRSVGSGLAAPVTGTGSGRWVGGPKDVGPDEFEARLRRRSHLARAASVVTIGLIGIVLVKIAFALGLARLWTTSAAMLTEQQRTTIRDEIDRQRVAAYRSDDAWRAALRTRRRPTSASADPCPATAVLKQQLARSFKDSFSEASPDAPFPLVPIGPDGEPPLKSPRTNAILAALDAVAQLLATAHANEYETLRARLMEAHVVPVDIVVELDRGPDRIHVWAWAYDHAAGRIVCTGNGDFPGTISTQEPRGTPAPSSKPCARMIGTQRSAHDRPRRSVAVLTRRSDANSSAGYLNETAAGTASTPTTTTLIPPAWIKELDGRARRGSRTDQDRIVAD